MNKSPLLYPTAWPSPERRRLADRRKLTGRTFVYGACFGRRHHYRRKDLQGLVYVDRYDTRLMVASVGLIVFCCLDAFLTLILMDRGAREINPLMDAVIRYDAMAFFCTKIGLTALGLVFLVPLQNLRLLGRWQVKSLIHVLFAAYACLIGYEWLLIEVM